MTKARATIGLIDIYDGGNLGDQALMQATVSYFSRRRPPVDPVLFTVRPSRTSRIHAAPAFLLTPGKGASYLHGERKERSRDARKVMNQGSPAASVDPRPASLPAWRESLKRLVARWPRLHAWVRRTRDGLSRVVWEVVHGVEMFRVVRRLDAVVVNGGGQLTDEWGGPRGQPLTLAKFAVLCRLAGTPFLFLSVGVGKAGSRLSRSLFRLALRTASYVSLRDQDSLEAMRAWHRTDGIQCRPDLAFAFRPEPGPGSSPAPTERGPGRVLAVSPITYLKPGVWYRSDQAGFDRYRDRMSRFVRDQVAVGHTVRLFATSPMEWDLLDQLEQGARRLGAEGPVEVYRPSGYDDAMERLLSALSGADVVVASRLHGVILAHVMGIPAVALTYDRKVQAHMELMEAESSSIPFGEATPERIQAQVSDLLSDRERVAARIRSVAQRHRAAVEAQYEELLASLGAAGPEPSAVGAASGALPQEG